MKSKQELLNEIREGLSAGIVTENDIRSLLTSSPLPIPTKAQAAEKTIETKVKKPSAIDIMFYVAGIVLFAAILSFIVQTRHGSTASHILMSTGLGMLLWALAYYLAKSPEQSDIRSGMINTSLLTGSLLNITGGYIIVNELVGGYDKINFIPSAIMLLIVGAMHIGFDRLLRRDLLLLMGLLLSVISFPSFMFGVLQNMDVSIDVWAFILIGSACFLALSTRVVASLDASRQNTRRSFDGFAAFVGLLIMYIASFGENHLFWLMLLTISVFGFFYLSVLARSKHLLGIASFFLVLAVVTISFRYFSGYGITTALILSTIGLLGSAALASHINRKYLKASLPQAQAEQTQQHEQAEQSSSNNEQPPNQVQ